MGRGRRSLPVLIKVNERYSRQTLYPRKGGAHSKCSRSQGSLATGAGGPSHRSGSKPAWPTARTGHPYPRFMALGTRSYRASLSPRPAHELPPTGGRGKLMPGTRWANSRGHCPQAPAFRELKLRAARPRIWSRRAKTSDARCVF